MLMPHFEQAGISDINAQGKITEIRPGLRTGFLIDCFNQKIYFAAEKMNERRAEIWDSYATSCEDVAGFLHHNLNLVTQTHSNNIDINEFKLARFYRNFPMSELSRFISKVISSGQDLNKLRQILIGLVDGALTFNPIKMLEEENRNVLYVSTKPITDFNFEHEKFNATQWESDNLEFKHFVENTNHISMAVCMKYEGEVSEHRGIFKTPLAAMNQQRADFSHKGIRTGGLSMALHLFGAACAKQDNMKYLTLAPLENMTAIFTAAMDHEIKHGSVIVGDRQIKRAGLRWCLGVYDNRVDTPIVAGLNNIKNKLWSINN